MALGKKYYAGYESANGWEYYVEIWVEGATSAAEIKLGTGGPVINYDTDDEDRFNPILCSTLTLPVVVEEAGAFENFIFDLRNTYEEREVYVNLYRSSGATNLIWSGYALIDLSDYNDEYYPYDVNIRCTDGLALLKDKDFVVSTASPPYDASDMHWGPATFIYWIGYILSKFTGAGGTAEGTPADARIITSVEWYNAEHAAASQANDPLELTGGKMSWTHNQDLNGEYHPMNCYDVLKAIMRAWGCRITYWNHNFYIVQLPQYNTASTGTLAAPVNINIRTYSLAGASISNSDHIDMGNLRYQLEVNFATPSEGLQKLEGTKYTFYPSVKKVTADFINGGGANCYSGFPDYDGSSLTSPVVQQTVVGASFSSNLYLNIPLKVQQTYAGTISYTFRFTIKASQSGSTTLYLHADASTATGYAWESSAPTAGLGEHPQGICSVSGTSPQDKIIFNELLPTDATFVGAWDFEIQMDDSNWGTPASTSFTAEDGNVAYGTIESLPSAYGTTWSNIPANVFGISNLNLVGTNQYITGYNQLGNPIYGSQFEGHLMAINSNAGVNQYGSNIIIETNTSDSDIIRMGKLQYGDTFDGTDEGALQVWNGSAWVATDFAGEWGLTTTSGTDSFTELLLKQFIKGQNTNIITINGRLVVGATGKNDEYLSVDYPKYINPIGRIQENPSVESARNFVFKRGAFHTAMDEWDYEGWAIKANTPTLTSRDDTLYRSDLPILDDSGGPSPRLANPNSDPIIMSRNGAITETTAGITGTLTSIPIVAIGTALFVAGDKIVLIDRYSNDVHELEVNATQAYDATSITIVSYGFHPTYTIPAGAIIVHNKLDLIKQYQNKTRGTVAGFTIDADGIAKGGIEITGWLDDDSMGTASVNTLATSESIKAYVDASGGGGKLKTVRITLTQAELNSAYTTPITLVAKQGTDKVICPVNAYGWAERNGTNSVNMDVVIGWDDANVFTDAILYFRRYFYNLTTDFVTAFKPYRDNLGTTLATGKDKKVTFAFTANPTNNSFTEIKVAFSYYVIDLS